MSGDTVNPLVRDYGQVSADVSARKKLYDEYNADWSTFEAMFAEMKSGKISPDELVNYFFYVLMPLMLGKTEDSLTIDGDELNVLSDYRSLIGKAQSAFNKFSTGEGTDADYQNLKDTLQHILDGLKIDSGNSTVLDDSTSSEIQTAIDALMGPKGLLIPPDTFSGSGADYLNTLWKDSKKPTGSKDIKIPGASQNIKSITDNFNTINTASSTISQSTQTKVQYQSSAYQQQLGLDNNTLQTRAKFNATLVQNEKTS